MDEIIHNDETNKVIITPVKTGYKLLATALSGLIVGSALIVLA